MPNSVLWVCLVAVWLFVLVPMVIKGRPEVTKTTRATLATRVLDRGGAAMSRATRRIATGRHPHDADWVAPVREYLKPGELINDDDDHATTRGETGAAVLVDDDPADDETADDETADDETAENDRAENDPTHGEAPDDADVAAEVDDAVADEPAAGEPESAVVDAPVSRSARGGYDPDADSRRIATRYRARQRVTAMLGVVAIVALGVGVVMGGIAWAAAGVAIGALAVYMVYLRRTVRMEERIRRRRRTRAASAGRVARARARQFDDVGDPFEDEIPSHLRRPGAVVLEIDDEHPVFDHLPPFQRRRIVRDEPEYRRAVGQ